VVITYEEGKTRERKRMGVVYVRPEKDVTEIDKCLDGMKNCNMIIGDMNVRNPIWGKESGDRRTNGYGRQLAK